MMNLTPVGPAKQKNSSTIIWIVAMLVAFFGSVVATYLIAQSLDQKPDLENVQVSSPVDTSTSNSSSKSDRSITATPPSSMSVRSQTAEAASAANMIRKKS